MELIDKISRCSTIEELNALRLDVIHKSKEQIKADPNCLDRFGRAPIQVAFIAKKLSIEYGIEFDDRKYLKDLRLFLKLCLRTWKLDPEEYPETIRECERLLKQTEAKLSGNSDTWLGSGYYRKESGEIVKR